jgi:hypothetical protein
MFRIEQLEQRVPGGAAAAPPAEAPAPQRAPDPEPQPQAKPAPPPAPAPPPQTRAVASQSAAPAVEAEVQPAAQTEADIDLERLVHLWPAALEVIGEDNELLGAALAEARPYALDAGRLVIAFPPGSDFTRKKAEAKRDVVQRAIHGLTGATLVISCETSEEAAPVQARKITTDELIESVKRDFAATELDPPASDHTTE